MSNLAERSRAYRARLLLVVIVLLAFALRLVSLEGREIWYDEAFAVLYAEKGIGAIIYGTLAQIEGAAADIHPLLYYTLLHGWMGLGKTPFVVRFPSVCFGLVTICLVYRLGRELFNPEAGLLAAALSAVSPFHIWYSQEARMYSLLCLNSLLSIYFFVRVWRRRERIDWIGFGIFAALSLYTHNLSFLVLLTLDLFVIVRREWRLIRPLLAAHLLAGILFLPWLVLVPGQLAKVHQAYWIPKPGLSELVRTLMVFTFNLPIPDWLLPFSLFFSLLVLCLTLYRTFRPTAMLREAASWPTYLTIGLVFIPVIAMFLVSQVRGVYIERAVLVCALAYYLAVAQAALRRHLPRFVILSLTPVPIVLACALSYQYSYCEFPRSPFRKVNAHLREHRQSGDVIIHDNKLSFFPSHYYDRDLPQEYIGDMPGSATDTLALPTQEALGLLAKTDMSDAADGAQRVWLVIFQRALDEAEELGVPNANKTWLDNRYRLARTDKYNDLNVYLYESQ